MLACAKSWGSRRRRGLDWIDRADVRRLRYPTSFRLRDRSPIASSPPMRANEPVALLQPPPELAWKPGKPESGAPPVVPPVAAVLSQTAAVVQAGVQEVSEQVWFS